MRVRPALQRRIVALVNEIAGKGWRVTPLRCSLLHFEVSVPKGQRGCATPFPIAEVFGAGSKFLETIGFFERLVVGLEEGSLRCSEVRFFCLPCSGWR